MLQRESKNEKRGAARRRESKEKSFDVVVGKSNGRG